MFSTRTLSSFFAFCSALVAATPAKIGSVCNTAGAKLQLPSNQTQLALPSGQTPKFIAVGSGVQNYTCGTTGTFT